MPVESPAPVRCHDLPPRTPCPGCVPTPRERRRAKHRAWQHRDRQSRVGKPLPVFDPRPA